MSENNTDQEAFLKSLNPLNVLLEEMRQPSVKKRVQTIKNLTTISTALGPEKSRVFLIPFINQLFKDEEEIQRELIKLIPSLINYIGGPYHAHLLFDIIFNQLYKQEEGQIRDELLQCLKLIFKQINLKHFEKLLMDFTNRTLQNDNFRQKETSIVLIPEFFAQISEEYQKEVIEIIQKLSTDQTPMVRKCICQKLVDFAKTIPVFPEKDILDIFENLLQDENDFVRVPLLETLIVLKDKITMKTQEELNKVFIDKILQDKSSKIKCNIIEQTELLINSMEKNIINNHLIPKLTGFLDQDSDNEVKIKCLQNMLTFNNLIPDFNSIFIPKLKALTKEKGNQIKNNLGDSVINLLQEGKLENLKGLEEVLQDLLEESDNEQKFKLLKKVKNFGKLQQNLSPNIIQNFIKSIDSIFQSKKWRMKTSALNTIQRLIQEARLKEDQLDKNILVIIQTALKDNIAEVRLEGAKTVGILAANFPQDFTQKHILPTFFDLFSNNNYLLRIGAYFLLKYSCQYLSELFVFQQVLQFIEQGSGDKVPNIRIVCLEVIECLINNFGRENICQSQYNKILLKLQKDQDREVKQKAFYILKL